MDGPRAWNALTSAGVYLASMRLFLCAALGVLCIPQPGGDPLLRIPPARTSINIANQPVEIAAWGSVFTAPSHALRLEMTLDLADFQRNLTPVLAAQLNQSDKCGTRLSVERASLAPAAPSSVLTAYLHVERFGCVKAFGKEVVKRLVGGNAVVDVNLTPAVDQNRITLAAKVLKIDADGSLSEVLGAGSLGESIRKKAADRIESAVQKAANSRFMLPAALQDTATIQTAQFVDGGTGRLWIALTAEVHLSPEQFEDLQKRLPH